MLRNDRDVATEINCRLISDMKTAADLDKLTLAATRLQSMALPHTRFQDI